MPYALMKPTDAWRVFDLQCTTTTASIDFGMIYLRHVIESKARHFSSTRHIYDRRWPHRVPQQINLSFVHFRGIRSRKDCIDHWSWWFEPEYCANSIDARWSQMWLTVSEWLPLIVAAVIFHFVCVEIVHCIVSIRFRNVAITCSISRSVVHRKWPIFIRPDAHQNSKCCWYAFSVRMHERLDECVAAFD